MGYDANKAATFNKLRQAGVSEDAALAQAGITDADIGNYALGSNGQMGALVIGSGKVAGVDYENLTAAELREQARFDQGLKSVDYAETAAAPPGSIKPITYTTTSTETISGGGTTTIVAGPRQPNATSQAYADAYAAKNAEYNQFVKDNPSDFARKKQGLPPLTAEEKQQRQQQLDTLNQEKESLKNQQINAETPGTPSVITTPNTTTTTTTVETYKSSTNADVNIQNDPAVFQQAEAQIDNTPSIADANTARLPEPVDATEATIAQPTNQDEPRLFAAESVAPEEDPFEYERLQREQSLNDPVPTFEPEPVNDFVYDPDTGEMIPSDTAAADVARNYAPDNVNIDDDPAVRELDEQSRADAEAAYNEMDDPDSDYSAQTKAYLADAQAQATRQQRYNQTTKGDWRVRLRLATGANYLYQDSSNSLLRPLRDSDGVVFPYTPTINTSYAARYDPYDLTHSNYRGYFYRGSSVSDLQLQATFTAQDTREAEYVLAVIHFFRSATKMFYGKDQQRGTPPPLVYLSGYGEYQFNDHACVISNFQCPLT